MSETPNETTSYSVHRGELVRMRVDKWRGKITELADKTGMARTSLYRHFQNPQMDWDYILDIGDVINYDFSQDFPEIKMYTSSHVKESAGKYQRNNVKDEILEKAIHEIDRWKDIAYQNLQESQKHLAESQKWQKEYYDLLFKVNNPSKAS
jgi:hypothetical protein